MRKKFFAKVLSFLPHIAALLFFAVFSVFAWSEPSQSPPQNNAPAPINVGSVSQYKSGALGLGGVFHAFTDAFFDSKVGIGTTDPAEKLDIQGGDAKIGTVVIKGDGSISSNLNADKLDNQHASELRPPTGLYGMCTYEYPVGYNNCVRIGNILSPAYMTGSLQWCQAPGGQPHYQYGTADCACPAGYTIVRTPNVYYSSLTWPSYYVYTAFCYKN